MNIVVLDGYTLNPGDLGWDALRELGACEIYDRTAPDEIVSAMRIGRNRSHEQGQTRCGIYVGGPGLEVHWSYGDGLQRR